MADIPRTTLRVKVELDFGTAAAQLRDLAERLAALADELELPDRTEPAQEPALKRDPASTTGGSAILATPPRTRHMDQPPPRTPRAQPFGIGKDVTA